ncbi:hypothetical protein L1D16_21220 [Vibrio sp. Isolate31]|uniref:hypothetical protein n=1 Tax=unclassified Vibrio TaxID=2614977 RepID=UPI001EFE1D3F|nr:MULTISPECIES: hypothetical protein [unclassified Vibrio]MCG9553558.1 hypothetical protein [Vibrio sp. Isolate32]MCG9603249.1 hypothetical protein [Vibrio sp. Isolate31]
MAGVGSCSTAGCSCQQPTHGSEIHVQLLVEIQNGFIHRTAATNASITVILKLKGTIDFEIHLEAWLPI